MRLWKAVFRRWDDDTLHRWSKITLQVAIVAGGAAVFFFIFLEEFEIFQILCAVFALLLPCAGFISAGMCFELSDRSLDRIVDLLAEYEKRHGEIEMETKEDFERFLREGKRP